MTVDKSSKVARSQLEREVAKENPFLFWLLTDTETLQKYSQPFLEAFGRYLRGEDPY